MKRNIPIEKTVVPGSTVALEEIFRESYIFTSYQKDYVGGDYTISISGTYTPIKEDEMDILYIGSGGTGNANYGAPGSFIILGVTMPAYLVDEDFNINCKYDGTTWRVQFHIDMSGRTLIPGTILTNNSTALSKLVNGVSAQIIVCNGSNVPAYVAMTGDITITNAGVTAIGALKVLTGMINDLAVTTGKINTAAVTLAKLQDASANSIWLRDANTVGVLTEKVFTSAQILINNGAGFNVAVLSGDVTMTNGGVVTIANDAITTVKILDSAITETKVGSVTAGNIITGIVCSKYINNALITPLLTTATFNLCAFKAGDTILKVLVSVEGVTAANTISIGADATLRTAGALIDCFVVTANSAVLGNYNTELQAATYTGNELTSGAFVCDADGFMTIDSLNNVAGTGIIGITVYYIPA